MPGIFGAYRTEENVNDLMGKMALSMNPEGRFSVDRFTENQETMGIGRVSLGILNPIEQPVKDAENNCLIIFHGELYGRQNSSANDPEYVLQQYLEKGEQCASDLNGVFHFAIYDRRAEQIRLFSDKFGFQPLYYSLFDDCILFGAEVKALLEDERIPKNPDYQSFADFFRYGRILGQKTFFEDITLLAPGSVLTFNLRDSKTSLESYWQLDRLFVEKGNYNPGTSPEDVVSLLVESVNACGANKETLGISLSGGLDSRGILAGLGKDAEGIRTYTLGLPGCADQKLAEKIAGAAKTFHEFIELDQNYLEDFENMALRMIQLSDGMYHPYESTEMLSLEYFKRADFKISMRGHGGEIAKAALAYPVMVTLEVYSCSNAQDILNYIFNITNLVIRDIDHNKLFTPSLCDLMRDAARVSLEKSCGSVSESLAPADVCIYWYINEHIRREVVASLAIFRSQIEIRMPYIDEAYIKKLLELPVSERNQGEIHFKLIRRCMPELIRIPDSNTGAPLDAGPLRLLVTDKFNSLMKRLSVSGFRHYTESQRWYRERFKENTKKIIFSDRSRARNMYNMDTLNDVFEAHISGKKQYGHLLGTIVGMELWFRSFVD